MAFYKYIRMNKKRTKFHVKFQVVVNEMAKNVWGLFLPDIIAYYVGLYHISATFSKYFNITIIIVNANLPDCLQGL